MVCLTADWTPAKQAWSINNWPGASNLDHIQPLACCRQHKHVFERNPTMTSITPGERKQRDQDADARQWLPLHLSLGFSLSEMVTTALSLTDTKTRRMGVGNVLDLLQAGCEDEHQWQKAIETLGKLLREHPDAYRESGTWYDGAPSLLALAAAQEAAVVAKFKLYPSLHTEDEIDACAYKVFKYVLRALAQQPDTAMCGLQWVERVANLQPAS